MHYQKYIEHLSITLPGTMPMSSDEWDRAQREKTIDSALVLMNKFHYSATHALQSCGLQGDALDDARAEIMRRRGAD